MTDARPAATSRLRAGARRRQKAHTMSQLAATQTAMLLVTQVVNARRDQELLELDLEAWRELPPEEQHLALGLLLGILHSALDRVAAADTDFDPTAWVANVALHLTVAAERADEAHRGH